jgi:hypothetical protein
LNDLDIDQYLSLSIKTKRDRRDVIRQVREITGLDENAISQTIEACNDGTGRYSLEQVISLLFDDSNVSRSLDEHSHAVHILHAVAA